MSIQKSLVLIIIFITATVQANEHKKYEIPNTEVVPLKNSKSGEQYELYIQLPVTYSDNSDKKYPVLYVTDGPENFKLLSGAAEYLMENVILVGISWQRGVAAVDSRHWDYSPKWLKLETYKTGNADNYLSFIRNDVFKYVEKNYRTASNNRTYFGFSMGGLFGTHVLLTQPETFNNYILGSPYLARDLSKYYQFDKSLPLRNNNLKVNVFLSYGELEKGYGKNIESFIAKLRNENYQSLVLKKEIVKSAGHIKSFPETVVRAMYWLSDFIK